MMCGPMGAGGHGGVDGGGSWSSRVGNAEAERTVCKFTLFSLLCVFDICIIQKI